MNLKSSFCSLFPQTISKYYKQKLDIVWFPKESCFALIFFYVSCFYLLTSELFHWLLGRPQEHTEAAIPSLLAESEPAQVGWPVLRSAVE